MHGWSFNFIRYIVTKIPKTKAILNRLKKPNESKTEKDITDYKNIENETKMILNKLEKSNESKNQKRYHRTSD